MEHEVRKLLSPITRYLRRSSRPAAVVAAAAVAVVGVAA